MPATGKTNTKDQHKEYGFELPSGYLQPRRLPAACA